MGSCLRTEDRLRLTSRKVNGDSRNPDVLPTFLRVIPKWHRRHPQFFPMVRSSGTSGRHGGRRDRRSLAALDARPSAGVLGLGVPTARAPRPACRPVLYLSTGALGAAAGDAALGLADALLRAAGALGPGPARLHDQLRGRPARPVHVPGRRALLPLHLAGRGADERARALGHRRRPVGRPHRRAPRPTGVGRRPGSMWAPDVAQFGGHYMLYFTSQLAGVTPPTMCIGDAISTAVAGPYLASPAPFICQQSLGGSIDPRVFVDATGQPYMVWKSDQNARSSHRRHADLQPAAQRRRHAPGGTADRDLRARRSPGRGTSWRRPSSSSSAAATTSSTREDGSTSPATPSASPAAPGRSARAPTCPPRRCCLRTRRAQGPGEESVFANAAGVWLALHAVPLHPPAPGAAPPRRHGPPRLRARRALPGGAASRCADPPERRGAVRPA